MSQTELEKYTFNAGYATVNILSFGKS